jgi:hypothetical protein
MSMLSEFQQDELWRHWIEAEIRSDYFADMGTRYARCHSWLTWLTLLFSAGTISAIVSEFARKYTIVLSAFATGLSLTSLIMQNPKKAAECADLHFKWNRLAADYQALWNNVYSDDAETKFTSLLEKEAELSKSSMVIPNKPKIVEKWERHVLSHRVGTTANA